MEQLMMVDPAPPDTPPRSDDGLLKETSRAPALRQSLCLAALLTQAPNWSGPLVCDFLTSQDRLALFSTCRGTSRTLLTTADHASIRLHVDRTTSMAHLHAIKHAMLARGKPRTQLDLTAQDKPLLLHTLELLGSVPWLDELAVEAMQPAGGKAVVTHYMMSTTVTAITCCCPNLRALDIHTPLSGLPAPHHLTKLEDLTVHLPLDHTRREHIFRALGLYLKRLTRLTIRGTLLPPTLLPLLPGPPGGLGSSVHTISVHLKPGTIMGAASHHQPFNLRLGDLITEASNWSCILVTVCLDPKARLALFHTCKGSRRMVLETAERTTVRLRVTSQHLEPLKLKGLLATMTTMQAHGGLHPTQPLKLHLSTTTAPLMAITLGLMTGRLDWLHELDLEVVPESNSHQADELPTTALASAARCCPNLRALDIRTRTHELPSPELFPKLQELGVHYSPSEGLARSIAPFASQLTRLNVAQSSWWARTRLPLLLTPEHTGARLHALHLTTCVLDDMLLGLLLASTPQLEELHVQSIDLRSPAHADKTTAWQRLHCSQEKWQISSLAHLPLAPALEITCNLPPTTSRITVTCDITSAQAAEVAAGRFKALRFTTRETDPPRELIVDVQMRPAPGFAGNHDALRAGLALLRSWGFADNLSPYITLQHWTMSVQLLPVLGGLPRWHAVSFTDLKWLPQPQPYYEPLLRLLPDSYTAVQIAKERKEAEGGLTATQVTSLMLSICLGAPQDRSAAAPLRVVLTGYGQEVVQAVQIRMMLQGGFANVVVD